MTPMVSIIIPVYNVEDYLEKCLSSVVEQSLKEIEIIIVNDESTDNSLNIIKAYAANDSRIIIINQKNKGLGGARNSGIDIATGEYLFFLDSDDYIRNNTLDYLYHYATENLLDLVVFNYEKVDEYGKVIHKTNFGNDIVSKDDAFRKIVGHRTSPQAWNKLYKRHLFTDTDIRYPQKFLHEDLPVTYKVFWYAERIGYTNECFYSWLTRGDSITQKFTFKHIDDIASSLLQKKQFLEEKNVIENYELEYTRGSIQMLNILLERSVRLSDNDIALMTHTQSIIDKGHIVNKNQITMLKKYDPILHNKFINNYNHVINIIKKEKHNKKYSVRFINNLLPKDSRRRKIIKNILKRT